jgi:hypothetical protein
LLEDRAKVKNLRILSLDDSYRACRLQAKTEEAKSILAHIELIAEDEFAAGMPVGEE